MTNSTMPLSVSTARLNLLLALGYAVLGGVGLMLGSPPSFASPIFPAAGLTLAVVLVYGLQAVPGAMLGDFVLMVVYAWFNDGINETSLTVAGLSAIGAAARAGAGYWLIRRWQGANWRVMEHERDVLHFMILGGLVSSLVSASICVPGMVLLQHITLAEVPYTWWTWYIGDAVGITLFTPLSLCFLLEKKQIWRDRRRRIVLPTMFAVCIFSAIFYTAIGWEKHQVTDHLDADGNLIAERISDRLTKHREILVSLRNFVEATPTLTFDKFQQFTHHSLQENTEISAFSLNDLVSAQHRISYETESNALSPSGKFVILESDSQRQLVKAGTRPQHGPVRFVVPLIIHHPVVGQDYFSEPVWRQAIENAMSSRSLSMTAPMVQLDEAGKRIVVKAFHPFYRINDSNNTGWRETRGFVGEVLYLDTMIGSAIKGVTYHDLVIQLRDATDPLEKTVIYQSDKPNNEFTTFSDSEVAWTKTFGAANRQWELVLVPTERFGALTRPWGAWAIGAAGLFFASVLQMLMLGMTGRTAVMKRKNQQLQSALDRAKLADKVIANSSEAIVVTDAAGTVRSINPTFTSMTGYSAEDLQGKSIGVLKSEQHSPEFFSEMWLELSTFRQWKGELWQRGKNGNVFPAWMTVSAVDEPGGIVSHYVAAFSDISEYKNDREKIEFLAFYDVLTKLPNRTLSADLLRQTISSATHRDKAIAVLFLGLDKFKNVNDTHGHAAGDALLKQVAHRLTSCLHSAALLGRLSGDEFMVVLSDAQEPNHVVRICKEILLHIAEPFNLPNLQLEISVSIGVALHPEHGADQDKLMRHADMALMNAKQDGRNTYSFFHEHMSHKVVHFVQTREALSLALQHNEFELHYQPQIDLKNGRVLGVEALIRWQRPYHGIVMPVQFIPVAEESGLIVPIGTWVLREACRQAASWSHAGRAHLVMAVNISSAQFRRGRLEEEVLAALKDSGLAPERLELELTESILLEDAESVLATVSRLKALGIQLSIDDFGTGYSSLSYLQRFNVDKLKIDRSFVMSLRQDQSNHALVQAIIQMAKSLNLRTIAEGVEDVAMAEKLKAFGCDEAQGYLYAKPLPVSALEQWLNAQAFSCPPPKALT